MRDEVNTPMKHMNGLLEPFGVAGGVGTILSTRALHWVPISISMPMPTHAHEFWVGMGAILFVRLRRLPLWVG